MLTTPGHPARPRPAARRRKAGPPFEGLQISTRWAGSLAVDVSGANPRFLPDQLNPAPLPGRVVGDQWYIFDRRLCGDHPIKRVFVGAWQPASKLAVRDAQRQRLPAILGDQLIEAFGKARGDRELAQAEFRCNLMPGNSAYKDRR